MPALGGCASSETEPALSKIPLPPRAAPPPGSGLDAVIDISHLSLVTDFAQVRGKGRVQGIIHKASEGGDWVDPTYAPRRPQAEAAGILWGAYHFGSRQYSGEDQAAAFLAAAQPGPRTLLALDFEPNDRHPSNTMEIGQAEIFVRAVYKATGRLPLVYTHPTWANGGVYGRARLHLRDSIGPDSILAHCDLWVVDYREAPEVPYAWANKGWRFWQYAGNRTSDDDAYGDTSRNIPGLDRCDRNLFNGDSATLHRYWGGRTVTS